MRWMLLIVVCMGCGGSESSSLCHRLAAWDTQHHLGSCKLYVPPNSISESQCVSGLANACSDFDRSQLGSYADCRDALPVCTSGQEQTYIGMLVGCDNIATLRVRYQCLNAL